MIILSTAICLSLVFFLFLKAFNKAIRDYEQHFKGTAKYGLQDIFIFIDPLQLWLVVVLFAITIGLLTWMFTLNIFIAIVCALISLILPPIFFHQLKKRRIKRYDDQLPDMLLSLSSALKSGIGMQSALKILIQEAPAPLSQEFGLALHEQRLGLSFDEAMDNLLRRIPTNANQMVISSLKVASQTGGNLSEVLERVAMTLRSIKQIEEKIQALTSQGKMQANVMIALPIFLLLVLNIGQEQGLHRLFTSTSGLVMLVVVVILEVCGYLFIRKITAIDI
ncbi:secretion system protein F [Pelistega indica]|uniref:Secretion system protein F n=1 Tax=Pelistega indica TaxID=1414851 RepID=V8G978_9BURK|nr:MULTISPECIES: type II secretion system F family protein [Pelistega]ETD73084.1 secretion system protein F [Pelistega indica]